MGKSSRQLWKAYIVGKHNGKTSVSTPASSRLELKKFEGIILGIDPSLRGTGLAVIEFSSGGSIKLLHKETIRIPQSKNSSACLAAISERCDWVSRNFCLSDIAVEQTIYVQNYKTAMTLGMAKGAALGVLSRGGYPVYEYPPLRIKQAIVGNGRASKVQVAAMVSRLLGVSEWACSDESDAAGAALCHGFTRKDPV